MKRSEKQWLSRFVYSPIISGIIILIFGVPLLFTVGGGKYAFGMVGCSALMFLIAFFNYRSYRKEEERERNRQREKEEKERLYRQSQEKKTQATIQEQRKKIEELEQRLKEQEKNER